MTETDITPNIDVIAKECIALRVRMLNRAVTNLYDDALRPFGLKVSQMNILVAAWKMGIARPAEAAEQLQVDLSTLSRNVERMKARGWLEVIPDADGRAQPFHLTTAGRSLLEQAVPAWRKAQEKALARLGQDTVDRIGKAVRDLRTAKGKD